MGMGIGPRTAFAERFALLYVEAGDPPLKRVAQSVARAGRLDERGQPIRLSVQRISDWRRGQNVPARFAVLASVLEILVGQARKNQPRPVVEGLYDLDSWRSLWRDASDSPATGTDESPDVRTGHSTVCPYRGLAVFRQEDAAWFFGRERPTAALARLLSGNASGILTLVGASGAGKSSLLRAGLVPTLQKDGLQVDGSAQWPIVIMSPGEDPLASLANRIPDLTGGNVREAVTAHVEREAGPGARLVLIVDQFEELFTLCDDELRRERFVQLLHTASTPATPGGPAPALVVLGLRADFYGRCLDYPELAEALEERQMVLGPMTGAELRQAVAGPAKAAGLHLEPGLAEVMLRDINASGRPDAQDIGALPLLSHALLATWQRRQDGRLTIAGYRATGGIQGAVAATAESAWAELDAGGQTAARYTLLKLTRLGQDTQESRRPCAKQELLDEAADPEAANNALEVLARARLVTMDSLLVEITHEALLHAWPRLHGWIDQDRAGLLLRQRVEDDAADWNAQRWDPSLLYRGARLEAAQQWARTAGPSGPTSLAREFLARSARHSRRRVWAARSAVAAVLVFALIAGLAAAIGIMQRNDAVFAQITSEADRLRTTDPSLAAQLDLVAHQMRPADQGMSAALLSTQHTPLATPLIGHTGAVYLTSFSPNGQVLASASYDHTVRLWNVRDPAHPTALGHPLLGHTSWVSSAVFSPDGKVLATAGDDGTIRLWNVTDPAHPTTLAQPVVGGGGTIYLIAFSPDGHVLAAANQDRTVRLWNLADPSRPTPLGTPLRGQAGAVRSVAFSPDGRTMASGSDDDTIQLWNVADPAHATPIGAPLVGHSGTVHSVAFSPDGKILASGSDDKTARLWNTADPAHPTPLGPPLIGHVGAIWSVAFSADGHLLATGSADGTARLWNVTAPASAAPLGQPLAANTGGIFAVAFSPDDRTLATGSSDGIVRLWSLPATILLGQTSRILTVATNPARHLLATGSNDGTVQLWNTTDPAHPTAVGPPLTGPTSYAGTVAFSPDGQLLAVGSGDSTARLWDVTDPDHPTLATAPLLLRTRYANSVAISPDDRILVTGDTDETIQLWDISDPHHPTKLGVPLTGHTSYVNSIAFNPAGTVVATSSSDGTVRLWNVANPRHATALGAPLTGYTGQVRQATFSPDGHVLATASEDKTVRLWDVTDPAHPKQLGPPLAGPTDVVTSVAFSPDGQTLAAGSGDDTVWLWNIADAAHPADSMSLTGHTGGVNSVTFGSTGQTLVTGSDDNSALVWDLGLDSVIQRVCTTTRGVLTPAQWHQYLPQSSYAPPC